MVDVRGDVLRPPHCTTPAEVKANYNNNNNKSSFKSNENIHKKEDGSYYIVSAYKASSLARKYVAHYFKTAPQYCAIIESFPN